MKFTTVEFRKLSSVIGNYYAILEINLNNAATAAKKQ